MRRPTAASAAAAALLLLLAATATPAPAAARPGRWLSQVGDAGRSAEASGSPMHVVDTGLPAATPAASAAPTDAEAAPAQLAAAAAQFGDARGARMFSKSVAAGVIYANPAYRPTIATTIGPGGGAAAALANARSAGVFVQAGKVHAAGRWLPGPTARVAAYLPGDAAPLVRQAGAGELPIISTGDMAAATTYGANGVAAAVAAPGALYVGAGARASAIGDATGLYGGTWAGADSRAGGQLPGQRPGPRGIGMRPARWGSAGGADGGGKATAGGGRGRWESRPYWGGSQTSFSGARVFDDVAYGVSGVGGPVAIAAAGDALAVSQAGSLADATRNWPSQSGRRLLRAPGPR